MHVAGLRSVQYYCILKSCFHCIFRGMIEGGLNEVNFVEDGNNITTIVSTEKTTIELRLSVPKRFSVVAIVNM
jgi:hypothetical protein